MKKYRVEAFIVPSIIKCSIESNQIDDVKLANKLKDQSCDSVVEVEMDNDAEEANKLVDTYAKSCEKLENDEQPSLEFSEIFFEANEHIYDEIVPVENRKKDFKNEKVNNTEYTKAFFQIEEPIYDEPFVGNLININLKNNSNDYDVPQSRWTLATAKYRRFGIVAPKVPKRSSSLKSITEDIEGFDETFLEMCSLRHTNSCLPNIQQPEDISEAIFKEKWMQRLDGLRKLEALLKDKEIALQSRERLLFKKEKDLKILERLVKDKMKQTELYVKRYKKSLSSESITNNERNLESRSSTRSKIQIKNENLINSSNCPSKINLKAEQVYKDDQTLKNHPNLRNSLVNDRSSKRISSLRSKSKPHQKMKYDDLDSTLSADNGDSSFVITSKKFDPEIFKKPIAFTRSASERRSRVEQRTTVSRFINIPEKSKQIDSFTDILDEKTFKKISENILASQDQETKFLNYGLIDKKSCTDQKYTTTTNCANQQKLTYLNIECANKANNRRTGPKERPISWNEDSDDWLQRKRQAYNLATKNLANQNLANKENFNTYPKVNKTVKNAKKDSKGKKFSLFR